MKKSVQYTAITMVALSLTGCFDEESSQSSNRESRLISIDNENCTTEKLEQYIAEYGKESGQAIGSACFLRGSKDRFAHYSSATQNISVVIVNDQNCSSAELAKYESTVGIEELRSSCGQRKTKGPVKSKPMSW